MKMTIKTIAMACIAIGITITGCKKKEEATPTATPTPAPTKKELLIGKNWKVTAQTSNPAIDWNGNGIMVTDIYAQMTACDKDDILIFNSNFTTTNDEGVLKCNPASPQSTAGTWLFNSTETIITIDSSDLNIELLNSTTLKGDFVITGSGGVNYTITTTFTKQ